VQNAAQTYRTVARQISSPRELEAHLLLRFASQLQSIQDNRSDKKHGLESALFDNRQLWMVFLTSVTGEDNPLPVEIRQNVANLGLFVLNHTLSLIADPQPQRLAPLININRDIAAGLLGRAA
jgi:flagellar biosynthesis activator protein FlaF